jgi:hypothetical protein
MLFAPKLEGLFDFYTASRNVGDFDQLVFLLVADRLKQSFRDTCLRHVLTVATKDGWLDYAKLAEVADTFQVNQTNLCMGHVGCSGPQVVIRVSLNRKLIMYRKNPLSIVVQVYLEQMRNHRQRVSASPVV